MSRRLPGRPPTSTRLKREDCIAMAVRLLPNLPLLPRPDPTAWTVVVSEFYGVPVRFNLCLVRTARAWLCFCPQCGRRAAVLYFPPGSTEPGCRACLGLVYQSQYEYTPEWAQKFAGL